MNYPAKWNRNGPLDERYPSRSQQSSLRVLYILLGSGRNLVVGLDHSGLRDRRFGRGVCYKKSLFLRLVGLAVIAWGLKRMTYGTYR